MKKRLAIAGAATLVGLATVTGAAFAATQSSTASQQTLADKIATKFNLNKDEVQKVFDEDRADHLAQRQADIKTKLDQAVTDKKITQAQEDQIIAKMKELDSFRDTMKDKTDTASRDAMKAKMDEFKKWLDDNNISLKDLGVGPGFGHGGHHMRGGDNTGTPPADMM